MSKDYARTRRSSPRHRDSSSVPGWVWLITGIVTGAFIMFLIYLSGLAPVANHAAKTTPNTQTPKLPAIDVKKILEKPIFEFYDTLMNNEVISASNTTTSPTQDGSPTPIYMLQVASFKNLKDADSLKALLTLEGLDVNLAEFNNLGDTYHRVMVGPFSNTQKMAAAKKTLATHNLNPIVLQKKPGT